jgi:hydroxyacylglutathione hydrolase
MNSYTTPSLMRIADLPEDTLAYCAHEYTLDNIGFAKWVEPDNQALLDRGNQAHEQLLAPGHSVPSTIATEKATNPFLRVREASVIEAAQRHEGRDMRDSRDTFRSVRSWKDREYD